MINPIHSGSTSPKSSVEAAAESKEVDPKLRLERLHTASVDFEAMLLHEMFKSMEKTLQSGGLVGSGVSGSVYSGILLQTISHSMAENQSLGLADQLYRHTVENEPKLKKAEQEINQVKQEILSSMQLQDGSPEVNQAKLKALAEGKMDIHHITRYLGAGASPELAKQISLSGPTLEISKPADINIKDQPKIE